MAVEPDRLIEAIQNGLPICPEPYAALAENLSCSPADVIQGLSNLKDSGHFKRFGVIVKHRQLGYDANAMVVWDIPDDQVDAIAERLAAEDVVTLCYQRPRRLPDWPYNLFTMIHGKQRAIVVASIEDLRCRLELDHDHDVLFSTHCFKQRGARYF